MNPVITRERHVQRLAWMAEQLAARQALEAAGDPTGHGLGNTNAATWTTMRNRAIRHAHTDGVPLDAIAAATNLTPEAITTIVASQSSR